MKTFKQFLDEALKSSVVQASARHQYQSQAVKQRVGGGGSPSGTTGRFQVGGGQGYGVSGIKLAT